VEVGSSSVRGQDMLFYQSLESLYINVGRDVRSPSIIWIRNTSVITLALFEIFKLTFLSHANTKK